MEVLSPAPDPLGGPSSIGAPDRMQGGASTSYERQAGAYDKQGGASAAYDRLEARRVQTYVNILQPQRPWLGLYNSFVKVTAPAVGVRAPPEQALLHRVLPEDFLFEIFARASPYTLGRAMCVCRKWRYMIRFCPPLWQTACIRAWQSIGFAENARLCQTLYEGSWRRMFLERPRIRTDGIYVSRNTYVKAGVAEWTARKSVHIVVWFRYLRFTPGGRVLYKTSPHRLGQVYRNLQGLRSNPGEMVYGGRCSLKGDEVEAAIKYPGTRPTVLRLKLRLRGTHLGAWNRLDIKSIITTGLEVKPGDEEENVLYETEDWDEGYTANQDVPAVSHKRGMMAFVFVPFEEVETSVLNLPIEKMDYYVPG